MCFDSDSLPPIPVLTGGALKHEDVVLEANDGNHFAAFAALPDESSDTGVVILPDVRGLYRFYEELALRFAERGYAAIAIDYFGRTAGTEKRGDEFEYRPHVEQTTPEGVQADTRAAVEWLLERGSTNVFTVGFCFGGRNSWLATAADHGLAGAVGFYGRPPLDKAAEMKSPILALQAGADQNITAEDNAAFDEALTKAGVEHELVTYEGAPHSFFDRKQENFAEASADAWQKTLEFLERHRS
ncbi:MAG TPA: dienelactone hydrolase family protein [Gaiellaceae bacterium]